MISGPSGSGKSTIVKVLKERVENLGYSISHTSRKPRSTEKNGIDYCFVDRETFTRMIEAGDFVEWAKVYHDFYGTSFSNLNEQTSSGLDLLLDLDAQGARNIKKRFENSVLIYVLPPSLEILQKRLIDRGTDDESLIKTRMEKALNEIKKCVWYDYIVINDDLDKAIGEVQSIIISKRCQTARRVPRVKKLFGIPLPQ